MKKPSAGAAHLTPDATGWRVRAAGGTAQSMRTLEEAVGSIPLGQPIHLALPCHAALLERLTLPSTDRTELAGMIQLQLEKTLPYPVEQVSSDFEVISSSENESTLLSIAAPTAHLEALCQPFRSRSRLPGKITLYAAHVAASCARDQVVLCIWEEDAQLVVAICEQGKLGFAQTLPSADVAALTSELPQMLLSAEMEGVPTDFASVRVEQGCAHLADALQPFFEGVPIESMSFDEPLPDAGGNLLPPDWLNESRRLESAGHLKQRLQTVAMIYLVLVAAAFAYLAFLKSRVQKVDARLAETQPQVEFVQAQQARWLALAPAIDPGRSAVEIISLVFNNLPTSEVQFTIFDYTPGSTATQFSLQGEAPSANLAIEYVEKLRVEPGLSSLKIEANPPSILPTGSAKFQVFGKL